MLNLRRLLPFLLFLLLPCPLSAAPGDADNDGLRDAVETNTGIFVSAENTGTNPNLADSDGDSMPDGMELRVGTIPTSAASKIKRPNIILINCDDLGYGDVGCFWQNQRTGTRKFATPNLDEMAAQGAMMTHHYGGAPICAPSRASLMQGRHQGHSDIRDRMFDVALPDNHSIASVLKASGYQTVHVGKAGLTGNSGWTGAIPKSPLPANPLFRGFNRFFGMPMHTWAHEHYPRNGTTSLGSFIYDDQQRITGAHRDLYSSDAWTGFAKKTIIEETTTNPNRPFFLYVAYDTPHFLGQTPPTRDYPAGRGRFGGIQWTGAPSYVNTAIDDENRIDNIANMHPSVDPTWPLWNQHHVTMIRRLDDSVADILQTLRDLNIADNTLVIFTSDNGPDSFRLNTQFFQGYAGFEGEKQIIYEGGIRVPTIAWWPGSIPASNQLSNIRRIANPSANYDWLATFAEIALSPIPSYTDGASVLPDLTGQGSRNAKDYLYFEFWTAGVINSYQDWPNHSYETIGQMQAIRIGDFMGVRPNIITGAESFRIYNVVNDPKQGINLATSRPDLQNRMRYLSIAARRPIEAPTVPSAIRPYDTTPLSALPPIPVRNGVKWKAYEGYWPWLPEFRHLTPVSSGNTTSLTTSVLTRGNDAGATFEAYLSVPATGSYTFQLAANSNCNLWLHEAHVIDNDYNFTAIKSGLPIPLSAGLHPIRLYYRHQTGTPQLQLNWSGPGFTMQPVPAAALFVDGQPTVLGPDRFETVRNTPPLIPVLANDSAEGPLVLHSAGSPLFGSAVIEGTGIRYTPNPDFIGTERFTYQVNDSVSLKTCQVDGTILYENEIWFPLDEGQGDIVRQAGDGPASGMLTTAAIPATSWVAGRAGRALRFDGTSDIVTFGNLPLPMGKAPRTFSCWIRTSSVNPPEKQAVFSYGGTGGGQRFTVRLAADPALPSRHVVKLETGGGTYVGSTRVNDGLWHHLAVSLADRDGNNILDILECRIHIDGNPDIGLVETPGSVFTTQDLVSPALGGSNHAQDYNFTGVIDDLRVFPKALDTTDVLFLSQHPPLTPDYPQPSVTPDPDSDGDGVSDVAEMVAGTEPENSQSYPRINSITKDGSGFRLSWPVVAGRTYQVEESQDMKKWKLVEGLAPRVAEVTVPDMTSTLPANGNPQRFFRLRINLTPAEAAQPNADSDEDGFTDTVELVAGTDPGDPSSFFRIESMTMTGGAASLKWKGVAHRRYRVEESPDLMEWALVPGVPHVDAPQNMPNASLVVPANGETKRFLRMRVELKP